MQHNVKDSKTLIDINARNKYNDSRENVPQYRIMILIGVIDEKYSDFGTC